MKLNLEQIKSITTGAVCVEKEDDRIRFHRFTDRQEILYGKGGTGEEIVLKALHDTSVPTEEV